MSVPEWLRAQAVRLVQATGSMADRLYPVRRRGRLPKASTAVVVHLFHPDRWEAFAAALYRRPADATVVVTLPWGNRSLIPRIRADVPGAVVYVVPNKGRDVLPFLRVLPDLARHGCVWVLKLHSKKSPHTGFGDVWFDSALSSLLPEDVAGGDALRLARSRPDVGLIGPAGLYLAADVYLERNARHLAEVGGDLGVGRDWAADALESGAGFFGGTMFWARIASIAPLSALARPERFEPEAGQVDGTFAHALERAFGFLPALRGFQSLESDGRTVRPAVAHPLQPDTKD